MPEAMRTAVSQVDVLNLGQTKQFFRELGGYLDTISDGELVSGEDVRRKIIELSAKNFGTEMEKQ